MLPTPILDPVSRHAEIRSRQRAVSADTLALVVAFGDLDIPAGKSHFRRALSKHGRLELLDDGWPTALVERAARLTVVIADDGTIVTVYPGRPDARGPRRRPAARRCFRR
jgi:hypothetical protein